MEAIILLVFSFAITKIFRKAFRAWKLSKKLEPTNAFEELLVEASKDASLMPKVQHQLFFHNIFLLGKLVKGPDGEQMVSPKISKDKDGNNFATAYTSKEALEYVMLQVNQRNVPYVQVKALQAMQMLQLVKFPLILNLGLPTCLRFNTEAMKALLNDIIPGTGNETLGAGRHATIGQPASVPEGLLEALKNYVNRSSDLKNVYFGQQQIDGDIPRLLCVVVFNDTVAAKKKPDTFKDLLIIASPLSKGAPIDFVENNSDYDSLITCGAFVQVQA